jgi:hypothetical protein
VAAAAVPHVFNARKTTQNARFRLLQMIGTISPEQNYLTDVVAS